MHELGVVFHIMDSLESVAKENDVTQIQSVTIEIGEVCEDCSREFKSRNGRFYLGCVQLCDRKDEERQCRPDAGLY